MSVHEIIEAALNQKQAAKYLGISTGLLKKKRLNGEGPIYYRIGKRLIYRKDDLDTFLDSTRVETTGR